MTSQYIKPELELELEGRGLSDHGRPGRPGRSASVTDAHDPMTAQYIKPELELELEDNRKSPVAYLIISSASASESGDNDNADVVVARTAEQETDQKKGMDMLLAAAAEAREWTPVNSFRPGNGRSTPASTPTASTPSTSTSTAATARTHGWTPVNSSPLDSGSSFTAASTPPTGTAISVLIPQVAGQSPAANATAPQPQPQPITPLPKFFNIPTILRSAPFGAVLTAQRILITHGLVQLFDLPLCGAQATTLTTDLRRIFLLHAETLDRAAAFSRQISIPGSQSERFRQDAVMHDWNSFKELRRGFEIVVELRSEAEWVRQSWGGFGREDVVEGEVAVEDEDGEGDEEVGLPEWAAELLGREEVPWAPDAVETLVVAAEGWAARWLFLNQEAANRETKRQRAKDENEEEEKDVWSPNRLRRSPKKAKSEKLEEDVTEGWMPVVW
ncbi:hypothetical protein BZA05DRAFT_395171 [Tricharina praecox]|uniref:uncharacterized protein n=1 Tax=Tricharina praecox TaxID=43433 RepID=UPI00221FFE42|nr:uncharacterized protein BZA05DRAFT_395171 [Tricharina praecox]KAI5853945.1 hypothetical protein BZA05DRAFT_395171 [Tricharina praecox]